MMAFEGNSVENKSFWGRHRARVGHGAFEGGHFVLGEGTDHRPPSPAPDVEDDWSASASTVSFAPSDPAFESSVPHWTPLSGISGTPGGGALTTPQLERLRLRHDEGVGKRLFSRERRQSGEEEESQEENSVCSSRDENGAVKWNADAEYTEVSDTCPGILWLQNTTETPLDVSVVVTGLERNDMIDVSPAHLVLSPLQSASVCLTLERDRAHMKEDVMGLVVAATVSPPTAVAVPIIVRGSSDDGAWELEGDVATVLREEPKEREPRRVLEEVAAELPQERESSRADPLRPEAEQSSLPSKPVTAAPEPEGPSPLLRETNDEETNDEKTHRRDEGILDHASTLSRGVGSFTWRSGEETVERVLPDESDSRNETEPIQIGTKGFANIKEVGTSTSPTVTVFDTGRKCRGERSSRESVQEHGMQADKHVNNTPNNTAAASGWGKVPLGSERSVASFDQSVISQRTRGVAHHHPVTREIEEKTNRVLMMSYQGKGIYKAVQMKRRQPFRPVCRLGCAYFEDGTLVGSTGGRCVVQLHMKVQEGLRCTVERTVASVPGNTYAVEAAAIVCSFEGRDLMIQSASPRISEILLSKGVKSAFLSAVVCLRDSSGALQGEIVVQFAAFDVCVLACSYRNGVWVKNGGLASFLLSSDQETQRKKRLDKDHQTLLRCKELFTLTFERDDWACEADARECRVKYRVPTRSQVVLVATRLDGLLGPNGRDSSECSLNITNEGTETCSCILASAATYPLLKVEPSRLVIPPGESRVVTIARFGSTINVPQVFIEHLLCIDEMDPERVFFDCPVVFRNGSPRVKLRVPKDNIARQPTGKEPTVPLLPMGAGRYGRHVTIHNRGTTEGYVLFAGTESKRQPVVATPAFCSVGPGDSRDIALEWVHDEECGRETEVSFLFGDLRLLEMADIGTGTSNGERYARALRDYFLGGDEEGKADATKDLDRLALMESLRRDAARVALRLFCDGGEKVEESAESGRNAPIVSVIPQKLWFPSEEERPTGVITVINGGRHSVKVHAACSSSKIEIEPKQCRLEPFSDAIFHVSARSQPVGSLREEVTPVSLPNLPPLALPSTDKVTLRWAAGVCESFVRVQVLATGDDQQPKAGQKLSYADSYSKDWFYVKENSILFDPCSAGSSTVAKVSLCNRGDVDAVCCVGSLDGSPFSSSLCGRRTVLPARCTVRLKVRCSPVSCLPGKHSRDWIFSAARYRTDGESAEEETKISVRLECFVKEEKLVQLT